MSAFAIRGRVGGHSPAERPYSTTGYAPQIYTQSAITAPTDRSRKSVRTPMPLHAAHRLSSGLVASMVALGCPAPADLPPIASLYSWQAANGWCV